MGYVGCCLGCVFCYLVFVLGFYMVIEFYFVVVECNGDVGCVEVGLVFEGVFDLFVDIVCGGVMVNCQLVDDIEYVVDFVGGFFGFLCLEMLVDCVVECNLVVFDFDCDFVVGDEYVLGEDVENVFSDFVIGCFWSGSEVYFDFLCDCFYVVDMVCGFFGVLFFCVVFYEVVESDDVIVY